MGPVLDPRGGDFGPARWARVTLGALLLFGSTGLGTNGDHRLTERTLRDPASYFDKEGLVLMESPILPPTSADGRERISVLLRLPAGRRLGVEGVPGEEREVLRYPEGTLADRVDS